MRFYPYPTKLLTLFVVLFIGISSVSFAQLQKVTGTVRDKNTKQGLYAATVSIKGTTIGANTDIDGRFSINVDLNTPKVLVISYLGYEKSEVTISKTKTNVDINLSEVVVTSKEVTIQSSRLTEKQKEAPLTVESSDLISIKQNSA